MAQIDVANERVKKICDLLKNQTLDPAKEEARSIIEKAKKEAENILNEANKKKNQILEDADKECQNKKNLLETSLKLSAKQAISSLKQEIISHIFSPEFSHIVSDHLSKKEVIAKAIDTIIGLYKDKQSFSSVLIDLPSTIPPEEIVKELSDHVKEKITEKQLEIGSQQSGIIIHHKEDEIAIDITAKATADLLSRYIAEHLQHYIFNAE